MAHIAEISQSDSDFSRKLSSQHPSQQQIQPYDSVEESKDFTDQSPRKSSPRKDTKRKNSETSQSKNPEIDSDTESDLSDLLEKNEENMIQGMIQT